MSIKYGIDGKLYHCVAGIGATPAWLEMSNVKNLSLNMSAGEADVTTRGNGGFKATAALLKEASIEWESIWDPADTALQVIKAAFIARTHVGLAIMDGPVATVGSEGLWADCAITGFNRDENLEGAMVIKITAKPTYSANAPLWKVVAGA